MAVSLALLGIMSGKLSALDAATTLSSSSVATTSTLLRPAPVAYEYVSTDQQISARLKCTICHDPFIDPLMFPCKHVFCKHCISPLFSAEFNPFESTEEILSFDSVPCPTCRKPVTLSDAREGDATLQGANFVSRAAI